MSSGQVSLLLNERKGIRFNKFKGEPSLRVGLGPQFWVLCLYGSFLVNLFILLSSPQDRILVKSASRGDWVGFPASLPAFHPPLLPANLDPGAKAAFSLEKWNCETNHFDLDSSTKKEHLDPLLSEG